MVVSKWALDSLVAETLARLWLRADTGSPSFFGDMDVETRLSAHKFTPKATPGH